MPDLKISQLPVASTPLAGTELVPIVQGGVTDRTTVQAIMTSTVPSGTANGVLYLNGSKVATSGSAITFDGTNFATTGSATATKLIPTGNVTAGNGMYLPSANTVALSTNGNQRFILDANGQIGFGASTPNLWGSNFTSIKLGVFGGAVAGRTNNAGQVFITANAYNDNTNWVYDQSGAVTGLYQISAGVHSWHYAPSGTAGNTISFTQAMTLNASGNLGIGTSSPGFRLDVAGGGGRIIPSGGSSNTPADSGVGTLNVYSATSSITTRTGALRLESFSDMAINVGTGIAFSARINTAPNDNSYTFAKIGGYKENGSTGSGNGYMAFATTDNAGNLNERMRLDSSGNLGIGTNSPSAKLDVNGSIYIRNTTVKGILSNPSGDIFDIANAGGGATNPITFTTQSVERMRLDSSGNLGIGTSSPVGRLRLAGSNATAYPNQGGCLWLTDTNAVANEGNWGITSSLAAFRIITGNLTFSSGYSAYVIENSGTTNEVANHIWNTGTNQERLRITSTGNQIATQPAESAQNANATLTVANLQTRIITSNAAVTLTLPTGTDLDTYATSMATNTAFECTFIATTANAITIAANGNTTVGSLTVAGNTSGTFRFRKTAANTFTVYRVA